MKNENELQKILDETSKNEILRLREHYNENSELKDYFLQRIKKIYTKLLSTYFRFAILQECVIDVKENPKYYQNITAKDKKKIGLIFKKLQRICICFNIALDEYKNVALLIKSL